MNICEICKQREANKSINIGLDLGYHLGKYGHTTEIYHKVKPQCVAICSLYLCSKCENKIKEKNFFYIHILPQLKDVIKENLIKNMIIEGLK